MEVVELFIRAIEFEKLRVGGSRKKRERVETRIACVSARHQCAVSCWVSLMANIYIYIYIVIYRAKRERESLSCASEIGSC